MSHEKDTLINLSNHASIEVVQLLKSRADSRITYIASRDNMSSILNAMFLWVDSPEGHIYWATLQTMMRRELRNN